MPPDPVVADPSVTSSRHAFFKGARGALKGPAWILVMSFFGFGALAQDLGFTLLQTVIVAAFVYALPSQVVLITAMAQGMAVLPLFAAVAFSAVRLMPMTVSLMPLLRRDGQPRWRLYVASHFVAITVWLESMRRLPGLPRSVRLAYFFGFGIAMLTTSVAGGIAGYYLANAMPVMLAAALLFLMPLYFLVTLGGSARVPADRLAYVFGLVLGPVAFLAFPEGDLIITGLVGGTAAWLIGRRQAA